MSDDEQMASLPERLRRAAPRRAAARRSSARLDLRGSWGSTPTHARKRQTKLNACARWCPATKAVC
jgi:hypothetical protein